MPNLPLLVGLLQPCCKTALADIKDTLQRGHVLQALVATSGLWELLGSPPLDTLVSVSTADWSLFAQAAKGATLVARNECKQIAFDEFQNHPGGNLNQFWESMLESFE